MHTDIRMYPHVHEQCHTQTPHTHHTHVQMHAHRCRNTTHAQTRTHSVLFLFPNYPQPNRMEPRNTQSLGVPFWLGLYMQATMQRERPVTSAHMKGCIPQPIRVTWPASKPLIKIPGWGWMHTHTT